MKHIIELKMTKNQFNQIYLLPLTNRIRLKIIDFISELLDTRVTKIFEFLRRVPNFILCSKIYNSYTV